VASDQIQEDAVPDSSEAQRVRSKAHVRKVLMALSMGIFTAGLIAVDCWYVGLDIFFGLTVVALVVWCLVEFYAMCESRGMSPFHRFGTICGGAISLASWITVPGTISWFVAKLELAPGTAAFLRAWVGRDLVLLLAICAVFGALWLQATKRDNARTFESISTTLFGILYVPFLSSFLFALRHLGEDGTLAGPHWNTTGGGLLLSCLCVSKLADVGGYLVGRSFGKHRLIPRISPKKSYEGLAGGLVLSVGAAFLLNHYGCLPFDASWKVTLFALLVGGMGVLGDLAESLLKRGSGQKDTGNYIPGFGGILDVVDSILLSAPVAYFLSLLLLRSHG
jgi:phosphatidate cytidylyltransferase